MRLKGKIIITFLVCLIYTTSLISQTEDKQLNFNLFFGPEKFDLSTGKYVTENKDTVSIDVFRCYVSSVKLIYEDGKTYQERNSYHLLDAEDESTLSIHLKGTPDGTISKIEFDLGIDSSESVSGAMGGDLDPVKGMYWAWNSGYINAKLEGKSSSCKTLHHAFEFHIGGYLSPYKTLRHFSFDVNNTKSLVVNCDLAKWFTQIQLAQTNSIMIPGPQAVIMADKLKNLFSLQ